LSCSVLPPTGAAATQPCIFAVASFDGMACLSDFVDAEQKLRAAMARAGLHDDPQLPLARAFVTFDTPAGLVSRRNEVWLRLGQRDDAL
jgi:SOUL heme-binding protein